MNAPKIATSFPPAIENHIAKAALSVTGGRTPDVFHPVSCGFPPCRAVVARWCRRRCDSGPPSLSSVGRPASNLSRPHSESVRCPTEVDHAALAGLVPEGSREQWEAEP
jgi:hypothetical protein